MDLTQLSVFFPTKSKKNLGFSKPFSSPGSYPLAMAKLKRTDHEPEKYTAMTPAKKTPLLLGVF